MHSLRSMRLWKTVRGTAAGFEDGSDQKPWNMDKLQEEAGEGMKMESSPRASRKETPPPPQTPWF